MTSLEDPSWLDPAVLSARARAWGATMAGHLAADMAIHTAHVNSHAGLQLDRPALREEREERESQLLATGATRAVGAGERSIDEHPDPVRTCFERDRDRILHSSAFRRLAGKTQVFVYPGDHQRTRLTHAIEVAQVARSIAVACRANVALTEAIALGHDCGHGPFGHASEDALSPFLDTGFDHAQWGADVTLVPINLCLQTLDGIRNHSWSRPAPATAEGEIVSWADRIAYVCHDFEDALQAGIVSADALPEIVRERCGSSRSAQLNTFVRSCVEATTATGRVSATADVAEALAAFRRFNYEHIYMRDASRRQAEVVHSLLRALTEFYIEHPGLLPAPAGSPAVAEPGSTAAAHAAVRYVGGMTDRYVLDRAATHLGWDRSSLPSDLV